MFFKKKVPSTALKEFNKYPRSAWQLMGSAFSFKCMNAFIRIKRATQRQSPNSAALFKLNACPACKTSKQPFVNTKSCFHFVLFVSPLLHFQVNRFFPYAKLKLNRYQKTFCLIKESLIFRKVFFTT